MSANRYIRFVELSSGLIRDARIPLFSSKFSKKTYTQHQLLVILLQKEYLSEDYRDAVELTEIRDSIREKIHLKEIRKNFQKMPQFWRNMRFTSTNLPAVRPDEYRSSLQQRLIQEAFWFRWRRTGRRLS